MSVIHQGGGQHPPHPPAGPQPMSDADIRARALALVRAGLDPQEAAARAAAEERARSGMAAIQALTSTLAGNLSGYLAPIGQAYDSARAQQGAVNTELANRLGTVGQQGAAGLAQTLAGQPNAQAVAGQTGQIATGAANAGFAKGSAELSRLIANEAGAKEYAGKMPGVAALTGLQYGRNLQAQTTSELARTIRDMEASAPQEVERVYETLLGDEQRKADRVAAQKNSDRTFNFQRQLAQQNHLLATSKAGETVRHHREQEKAAATALGISVAKYRELVRSHLTAEQLRAAAARERARHNRTSESTASANAQTSAQRTAEQRRKDRVAEAQRRRAERERERHNRQSERNAAKKKGGGSKPPWVKP